MTLVSSALVSALVSAPATFAGLTKLTTEYCLDIFCKSITKCIWFGLAIGDLVQTSGRLTKCCPVCLAAHGPYCYWLYPGTPCNQRILFKIDRIDAFTTYNVCTSLCIGIDDARNTAKLCYRLVRDGCKLNITKCIHRKVSLLVTC